MSTPEEDWDAEMVRLDAKEKAEAEAESAFQQKARETAGRISGYVLCFLRDVNARHGATVESVRRQPREPMNVGGDMTLRSDRGVQWHSRVPASGSPAQFIVHESGTWVVRLGYANHDVTEYGDSFGFGESCELIVNLPSSVDLDALAKAALQDMITCVRAVW